MSSDDLRPEDVVAIRRLMQQLHGDAAAGFEPTVRQGHRSFVARDDDGAVVGYLLGTFVDYGLLTESCGMVEQLVIDFAHRRRGIGQQLLEQWKSWLKAEGVPLGFVATTDDLGAAEFYERCGFGRCTGPWLAWADPSANWK